MEYPISLDTFKSYFLREAGLEYQPYPTWVKTVWDNGDYCLYENTIYKCLTDLTHTAPVVGEDWEQVSETYEEGVTYPKDTVVYYNGLFYIATEDTAMLPSSFMGWAVCDIEKTFPDCREWKEPIAYNTEDKVIAIVNYKPSVWVSNVDDNYTNPADKATTEQDVPMWEISDEDTEEMADWILDLDILRAMGEAMFKFNPTVYPKDRQELIFLYLTMFFLVYDRQMAASGMNGNSASGPVTHRTVGKMSVTYMESKLYQKNPSYEFLSLNEYGKKAFNLMAPYLRGGVMTFCGSNTGD